MDIEENYGCVASILYSAAQDNNIKRWYVLRDLKRANSKDPAYKVLRDEFCLDAELFTPMTKRHVLRSGKSEIIEVPFVPDLLFVHGRRSELDPVINLIPTLQYRFVRGSYNMPMVVRDAEMRSFMKAVEVEKDCCYYTPHEVSPSIYGKKIRIIGGRLNGLEGRLMTTRGSKVKRLIVDLGGFLSVGVEICPDYIEVIK